MSRTAYRKLFILIFIINLMVKKEKKKKLKKKTHYKSKKLHYLSMGMMLIGFVMIAIPLISYLTGHTNIPSFISLIGIVIGIIGVYISKKNMDNILE